MPSNVVVNFGVNVGASGTIDVFGQAQPSYIGCNVLIASLPLPVTDLYNVSDALFKFIGSNDSILGARDLSFTTSSNTVSADITAILNNSFNCSNSLPFSSAKYNNMYNTQANFGNVAVAYYADKLFGHLAATAAIDNDSSIVTYMTGAGAGTANIGNILTSAMYNMSDSNVTAIVKQVLSQDASRAKAQDNDLQAPTTYQPLQFINGDVIFFSVTIQPPTVTYANSSAQQYKPSAAIGTSTFLIAANVGTSGGGPSPVTSVTLSIVNSKLVATDSNGADVPLMSLTNITTSDATVATVNIMTAEIFNAGSGTTTFSAEYGVIPVNSVSYTLSPTSVSFVIGDTTVNNGGSITLSSATTLIVRDNYGKNVTIDATLTPSTNVAISGQGTYTITPISAAVAQTFSVTYSGITSSISITTVASSITLWDGANQVTSSVTMDDLTVELMLTAKDNFGNDVTADASWSRTNNGTDSIFNVTTVATSSDEFNNNNTVPTINAGTKGVVSKLAPGQDVLTVTYANLTVSTTVIVSPYLRTYWAVVPEKTYRVMGSGDGLGLNVDSWSGSAWTQLTAANVLWSTLNAAVVMFNVGGNIVSSTTGPEATIVVQNAAAGAIGTVKTTLGGVNGVFQVVHS